MTGALSQTRFASLILALQLKARADQGLPTLVYGMRWVQIGCTPLSIAEKIETLSSKATVYLM